MINENETANSPTDQEIATCAYDLWEADGCQGGRDLDYWLKAKAQLMAKAGAGNQASNGQSVPRSQLDTGREGATAKPPASDRGAKQRKPESRPATTRQSVVA